MIGNSFTGRRESRKRRRLSERRRVFSRLGGNHAVNSSGDFTGTSSTEYSSWSSSAGAPDYPLARQNTTTGGGDSVSRRSDSPLAHQDNTKIQMKIQFHITVAPDDEPLIMELSSFATHEHDSSTPFPAPRPSPVSSTKQGRPAEGVKPMKSTESIGDQIHEKLTRQSTLSTRRRNQLLAMHNQAALENSNGVKVEATSGSHAKKDDSEHAHRSSMPECLPDSPSGDTPGPMLEQPFCGRESGARSSTITGGIMDEATVRFLARHHAYDTQRGAGGRSSVAAGRGSQATSLSAGQRQQACLSRASLINNQREHIYFKRDGQRFGHEFTLKLAVDKTYRCLLKVRPLIPLQGITIQGHQVLFIDCTHQGSSGKQNPLSAGDSNRATSVSAPASSSAINNSWQDIATASPMQTNSHSHNHHNHHRHKYHQSNHTVHNPSPASGSSGCLSSSSASQQHRQNWTQNVRQLNKELLYREQQQQMLRHFATSHCSTSNSHLGGQLIYMFDWSAAGRFEVNKNKNRTQVNAVLKFTNGQILSLPLQVKFYQPECRQHLNWGSQLHFIDFDCDINSMGQMNVCRIQYY